MSARLTACVAALLVIGAAVPQALASCPDFNPAPAYRVGSEPAVSHIAAGDFNGDGHADIAAASYDDSISILLGNGTGTFAGPSAYPVERSESIGVADVNGDSKEDLVLAHPFSHGISVLPGNGDGTFAAAVRTAAGNYEPRSFEIGDLNSDKKPDLVVYASQASSVGMIVILLGNGDGTFASPIPDGIGYDVAIGDFNTDGHTDFVAIHGSLLSVNLGRGNGTFSGSGVAVPSLYMLSIAVKDLNGDGRDDLALVTEPTHTYDFTVRQLSIMFGHGDGTFGPPVQYPTAHEPYFVTTGDFNRDFIPDILVAGDNLSVALGGGRGSFADPVHYMAGILRQSVVVRDLNGDGREDVVASSGSIYVLLATDDGFAGTRTYETSSMIAAFATGDLNGDGAIDVVVTTESDVAILAGQGNGTLAPPVSHNVGGNPGSVAIGDVNADGKSDLAISNHSASNPPSYTVSILLGNGDASFAAPQQFPVGASPGRLAIGDFNHDGKADLAVLYDTYRVGGQGVSILLGHGDGTFSTFFNLQTGGRPGSVGVGDFNQDGNDDVVVGNDLQNISLFMSNGDGTFAPAIQGPVSSLSLAAGDLNEDGKLDLIAGGLQVQVLFGNGDATFAPPVSYDLPANIPSVELLTIGDFNGDGTTDVGIAYSSSSTMAVLIGTSNGAFAPPMMPYPVGLQPDAMLAADFNGDGRDDVGFISGRSGEVAIKLSKCVPSPAATSLAPGQGPAGGRQYVTISGTALSGATAATFGGMLAPIIRNTESSLMVMTPAHSAGTVDVVITTTAGTTTLSAGYTYVDGPAHEASAGIPALSPQALLFLIAILAVFGVVATQRSGL